MSAVFVDTCLMGTHGMIICNVQDRLAEVFRLLGRDDLAEFVKNDAALFVVDPS